MVRRHPGSARTVTRFPFTTLVRSWYIGRAISAPITEMIGILTSIAAGKLAADVPGQHRRDEIGAMARRVAVFDRVTRDLRDREKLLEEAWQNAETPTVGKSTSLSNVRHDRRTPVNPTQPRPSRL